MRVPSSHLWLDIPHHQSSCSPSINLWVSLAHHILAGYDTVHPSQNPVPEDAARWSQAVILGKAMSLEVLKLSVPISIQLWSLPYSTEPWHLPLIFLCISALPPKMGNNPSFPSPVVCHFWTLMFFVPEAAFTRCLYSTWSNESTYWLQKYKK